ncbi:unnamed protein product, partial [Candidula unifasciata]
AFRSVCYYTNWAQYRPNEGKYVPENIDPSLCTHIIYAFSKPVELHVEAYEWNDDDTEYSKGMYSRVIKMKEKNPDLKVLLAIGGWNMASAPFIPLGQTKYSRETFAKNAVAFLRKRNFDGFDMDWEYPGSVERGSSAADKPKFQLLLEAIRQEFDDEAEHSGRPRLLLTAAVAAGKINIDNAYYVDKLSSTVDFINLMTYDLHGAWEPFVNIHTPLYPDPKEVGPARYLTVDWAAKYWVSLGAPKEKLNIGLASYGRSFKLANPDEHTILSKATGAGTAQTFTQQEGMMAYFEICNFINEKGATSVDLPIQIGRYAYKGNLWVGYDDEETIAQKTCYAKQNGYGGVFFWAPDLDDFTGQFCNKGNYPLLKASKNAINSPYTCSKTLSGDIGTDLPPEPWYNAVL